MGIQAQEEEEAEVSMSPLIDCVFLLLIFFIVSTMTKKQNNDIDISLPVSSSAEKLIPSNQELVIGIDQGKYIFFEGEPVSLNWLHAELREI